MKRGFLVKALFILVSSVSVTDLLAQASPETEATIDDLKVKPFRIPALQEISGTPFLTAEYKNATIHIPGGKFVPDMPVKFNILNNVILVQMDGQELKLESFTSVTYDEKEEDGSIKHYEFATGYPEIDKHNENSVYQVLSSGPQAHLIKYISQKVEDANTLGDYSRRELVKSEQLYIYVPGKEIKRIKPSKKEIAEALPALANKIEEITNNNNLKLKSESEIITLIEALNKP
jgi:hypothetical protein